MTYGQIDITPAPLPFGPDEKVFWVHGCDEDKEEINDCLKAGCYKISYNDSLQLYQDVSGINEELLGK